MRLGNSTNRQLMHQLIEIDGFRIILIIAACIVMFIGIYGMCLRPCFRRGIS